MSNAPRCTCTSLAVRCTSTQVQCHQFSPQGCRRRYLDISTFTATEHWPSDSSKKKVPSAVRRSNRGGELGHWDPLELSRKQYAISKRTLPIVRCAIVCDCSFEISLAITLSKAVFHLKTTRLPPTTDAEIAFLLSVTCIRSFGF
jgi:hypothetical protein